MYTELSYFAVVDSHLTVEALHYMINTDVCKESNLIGCELCSEHEWLKQYIIWWRLSKHEHRHGHHPQVRYAQINLCDGLFLCLYIEKCIQTNYSSFQVYILIIICVPWNEIRLFLYFIPCFFSTAADEILSHLDKSVFTPLAFGDADLPVTPTQGLTLDSKRWPLRINGIFKVWVWNEWILCSVRSSRYKWFKQYVFRRVLWKHRDWRGQSQNKCVLNTCMLGLWNVYYAFVRFI